MLHSPCSKRDVSRARSLAGSLSVYPKRRESRRVRIAAQHVVCALPQRSPLSASAGALRTAAALLLVACGAPAQRAAPDAPPVRTPAAPDSPAFRVTALTAPPATLVVDGDTSEWDAESGPANDDTESRLKEPGSFAVALTERGLAIAGHLPTGVESIRLDFRFAVPELPAVGSMTRTGEIQSPQCESDPVTGDPLPADERWRCEAPNRARAAFAESFAPRFRRLYQLRAHGRIVDATSGDDIAPVAWTAESGTESRGLRFETLIPAAELPMVATAPVDQAVIVITSADHATSHAPGETAEIAPAPPILFGPTGTVRAALFKAMDALPLWRPVVFYSPGDGNTVHHVSYAPGSGTSELEITEAQLVAPFGTVGDFTVADVFIGQPALGLLRAGKIVDVLTFERRDPRVRPESRGRGLHVYDVEDFEHETGCRTIRPRVLEIRADGTTEDVADAAAAPSGAPLCWQAATVEMKPGFTEVTIVGSAAPADEQRARPTSRTWRYDAKSGRYLVASR